MSNFILEQFILVLSARVYWVFPSLSTLGFLLLDSLGKKGHKGRGKQFSNPEEIERQMRAQREMVNIQYVYFSASQVPLSVTVMF